MIDLAELLDAHSAAQEIFLTETPAEIILAQVSADVAREVLGRVRALGWAVRVENAAAEMIDELNPAFAPFRFTITKPDFPGRTRILTLTGFSQWLRIEPLGLVQVARSQAPFETGSFRIGDWADVETFEPAQRAKSPRSLVREMQQQRVVPDDIRPWIISETLQPEWNDPTFQAWVEISTVQCLRSLATEVNAGSGFTFRGNAQLTVQEPEDDFRPPLNFFGNLQRAVRWVYENPSETETRFRLMNFEFGRLGRSPSVCINDVLDYSAVALESARLAFQYSLSKVSSESARALSDLRKSLSEETSRLSEMIRQVITAVSSAVFIGIGLIAARFSTNTPKLALVVMGFVLCGYVTLVIWSGHKHIKMQQEMRMTWRERLYGYISNNDYKKMILDPAGKAENHFHCSAYIGGGVTAAIAIAILIAVIS